MVGCKHWNDFCWCFQSSETNFIRNSIAHFQNTAGDANTESKKKKKTSGSNCTLRFHSTIVVNSFTQHKKWACWACWNTKTKLLKIKAENPRTTKWRSCWYKYWKSEKTKLSSLRLHANTIVNSYTQHKIWTLCWRFKSKQSGKPKDHQTTTGKKNFWKRK